MHTAQSSNVKASFIISAFLIVGLLADLLPHPALGPSVIMTGIHVLRGGPSEG